MLYDLKGALSNTIAQLSYQIGFERMSESSLELLIDVSLRYLRTLSSTIQHLSDDEPARLDDGILALRLVGPKPNSLIQFYRDVGPFFPRPIPVYCGLLAGKVELNIPPEGHPELLQRPEHIPSHLPLNFCSEQSIMGPSSNANALAVQQTQSNDSCNNSNQNSVNNVSCNTTSISKTESHRRHPPWAGQSTYRPVRVSFDSLTKSLVEHSPPEKVVDTFADLQLPVRSYGDIISLEQGFSPYLDDDGPTRLLSSSASHLETTDDQWAAALRTTPAPHPPPKRVTYKPSRFDPSALPSHTSSSDRRSLPKTSLFASTKRLTTAPLSTLHKKRPTQSIHHPSRNVAKLTTSSRRRRRSTTVHRNRAKRFKSNKNPNKLNSALVISDLPPRTRSISPFLTRPEDRLCSNSPAPIHSPSSASTIAASPLHPPSVADSDGSTPPARLNETLNIKVSPIKELHSSASAVSTTLCDINAGESTLEATNISSHIPSPYNSESCQPVIEQCISPVTSHLIQNVDLALGSTLVGSDSTYNSSVIQEVTPIQIKANLRVQSRPRKKTKGRRRAIPRVSLVNSLFQNPLRQGVSQNISDRSIKVNSTKPDNERSLVTRSTDRLPKESSSINPSINTTVERKLRESTEKDRSIIRSSQRALSIPKPVARAVKNKQPKPILSKASIKKPKSTAKQKTPSLSKSINQSPTSSPASGCTDPMTDEDRSMILLMSPDNASVESKVNHFAFNSTEDNKNSSLSISHPVPIFSSKTFSKMQSKPLTLVASNPSSPSSLDSLPSSSSTSSTYRSIPRIVDERIAFTSSMTSNTNQTVTKPINIKMDSPYLSHSAQTKTHFSSISDPFQYSASTVNPQTPQIPPKYPPPLLPLTKTLTLESHSTMSSDVARGTPLHDSPVDIESSPCPLLPPTLFPVSEASTCALKPDGSPLPDHSERLDSAETSSQLSSISSTGRLRIKIKFSGPNRRETFTSSLSRSESSSVLSSNSSSAATSPFVDHIPPHDLKPVLTNMKTSSQTVRDLPVVTTCGGLSIEGTSSPVLTSDQAGPGKNPKIVLRIGSNGSMLQTGSSQQTQSGAGDNNNNSSLVSRFSNMDPLGLSSASSKSMLQTSVAPPHPLQLKISRDHLQYRADLKNADLNDLGSSSGSESILGSSSDEDEYGPQRMLPASSSLPPPPPPCLQRLPTSRQTPMLSSPLVQSAVCPPLRIIPSRTASTFVSEAHPAISTSTVCHDLPPRLAPISGVQKTTPEKSVHVIPQLVPMMLTHTKSDSSLNSQHKEKSASKSRKLTHKRHSGRRKKSLIDLQKQPRARVDSVFTDDDDDNDQPVLTPDPLILSTGYLSKSSIIPVAPLPETSPTSNIPPETPYFPMVVPSETTVPPRRSKCRPRTKQTSENPRSSEVRTMVTQTAVLLKGQVKPGQGSVSRVKETAITPSSNAVIHQSGTTRQVVIPSAGSSYYFNNKGEQIWLCPMCLMEDDGNLMIGCDKCNDWYHSHCLGLMQEPNVPEWFCPKCSISASASHTSGAAKRSTGGTKRRHK